MVHIFISNASGAEAQSIPVAPQSISTAHAVFITDMRTEGVSQPLGVEEATPRFSWRYAASSQAPRGFQQAGCRIQVPVDAERVTRRDWNGYFAQIARRVARK